MSFGQVRIGPDRTRYGVVRVRDASLAVVRVEEAGPDVHRFGRDRKRLGQLRQHLGAGFAQAAFHLAEVRIGHPGPLRQLTQRELSVPALLAEVRTQRIDRPDPHTPHYACNCKQGQIVS